jgi:hypothetical protein
MRKIEMRMCQAVNCGKGATIGNTHVTPEGTVYLHGNRIAFRDASGKLQTDLETFNRWPTATTRSRLNALGLSYPKVKTLCGLPYASR